MIYQSNPETKEQFKKRYQENPELHKKKKKKIRYQKSQEKKKSCNKVDNFLQQVKQGRNLFNMSSKPIPTQCQIF